MHTKRPTLTRSDDRIIGGVIAGWAEYFGLEPTILRLATVFFVVATGLVPGILTYGVALLIMPAPSPASSSGEPSEEPARSERPPAEASVSQV